MPFEVENCDYSKILIKKRKALPCPTEGVSIDGKTDHGTQVESGFSMIHAYTNTSLVPVTRDTTVNNYPLLYDPSYKLDSAPRAGTLDDMILNRNPRFNLLVDYYHNNYYKKMKDEETDVSKPTY